MSSINTNHPNFILNNQFLSKVNNSNKNEVHENRSNVNEQNTKIQKCTTADLIRASKKVGIEKDKQQKKISLLPSRNQNVGDLQETSTQKPRDTLELYALIKRYFDGSQDVDQNYQKAVELSEEVLKNNPEDCVALGCLSRIYYYGGNGIDKNYAEAEKISHQFIKALEKLGLQPKKTVAKINFQLGMIHYRGGNGVERNVDEAFKYLGRIDKENNKQFYDLLSEDEQVQVDESLGLIQDAMELSL